MLLGKYGDEADKLVFKILRRGEHEASWRSRPGVALRHDRPAGQGRRGVWRPAADPVQALRDRPGLARRPAGRGRFREFTQCDVDTLGSTSPLADAEILCAHHDAMAALGLTDFTILLNSRQVLSGLLEVFAVPRELGPGVLTSLDKLDKMSPREVISELTGRGLSEQAQQNSSRR